MGDSQRLSDNEQLEILALLETVSTKRSAIGAARALAELMDHLHALGQRIAGELSEQDRNIRSARR
jgi:DNA repair protein RadC